MQYGVLSERVLAIQPSVLLRLRCMTKPEAHPVLSRSNPVQFYIVSSQCSWIVDYGELCDVDMVMGSIGG